MKLVKLNKKEEIKEEEKKEEIKNEENKEEEKKENDNYFDFHLYFDFHQFVIYLFHYLFLCQKKCLFHFFFWILLILFILE